MFSNRTKVKQFLFAMDTKTKTQRFCFKKLIGTNGSSRSIFRRIRNHGARDSDKPKPPTPDCYSESGFKTFLFERSWRSQVLDLGKISIFLDQEYCRTPVAPLLWPSVGVNPNTWKSWELESSGTSECSELDNKAQNTSHWNVLGVITKVLKHRYRKCPRIGNSGYLQPKLWAKEGSGVKLAVWLPTTKSRESMPFRHPIQDCNTALKRSRRGLQLWFRPRCDPTL
jgi:hypothetical protein